MNNVISLLPLHSSQVWYALPLPLQVCLCPTPPPPPPRYALPPQVCPTPYVPLATHIDHDNCLYLKVFNPELGFLEGLMLNRLSLLLLVQLLPESLLRVVHHQDENSQDHKVEDEEPGQQPRQVAPGIEGVVHVEHGGHCQVQREGCFK